MEISIALRDRISSLLDVVDALEAEVNLIADENKEKVIHERNFSNSKEGNTDVNLEKAEQEGNSISSSKKIDETGMYGKRCFYYSRGMCLRQKIRCTIEGNMCELYEHKNSRELIKEESCRNFIRYMRKGKINRVECSASGLPGCVGSDKCKFYLKKKKK